MMMTEPRIRYGDTAASGSIEETSRVVRVVLRLDWAQAVRRLQQLHNEGTMLVRVLEDEQGRVRIEPND